MDRLFSVQGSARTWYLADRLGSVRATSTDLGSVTSVASYVPYGQVQGTALGTFGFTGELQQGGNVYLRARWYDAGRGRFTARDPFAGWGELPYSLHYYQYGYADPVGNTDPTGECVPLGVKDWPQPLGFIFGPLGQADCEWIWNVGANPNWADLQRYGESVAEPWVESAQALYVLATDPMAQQAFAQEYAGPTGVYKLSADLAVATGEEIYKIGTDLGNGVACNDPNTTGRGLSRFVLFFGQFVAGKLAARGVSIIRTTTRLTAVALPTGFTQPSFQRFAAAARNLARRANLPKGELAVHGSRASGTAGVTSDIDIILRVDPATFDAFAAKRVGSVPPNTRLHKTLVKAAMKGELSRFDISREFNQLLAEHLAPFSPIDQIDFSIVKIGSEFDVGPFIPLGAP